MDWSCAIGRWCGIMERRYEIMSANVEDNLEYFGVGRENGRQILVGEVASAAQFADQWSDIGLPIESQQYIRTASSFNLT